MNLLDKLPFKLPNIRDIDEKNRNLILGGVMLGIFLADYFLFMQPLQLKPLMKLNPRIRMAEKNLKEARMDIKNIEQYKKDVIQHKKTMDLVGERILSREEIPKILDNISRLAINENVQISQIMPVGSSKQLVLKNDEGSYYSLSIFVEARGGYHDVGHFFNKIETNTMFMTITDFDITASENNQVKHKIKATIKAFILEKNKDEE